jgi:hypothetical protein
MSAGYPLLGPTPLARFELPRRRGVRLREGHCFASSESVMARVSDRLAIVGAAVLMTAMACVWLYQDYSAYRHHFPRADWWMYLLHTPSE